MSGKESQSLEETMRQCEQKTEPAIRKKGEKLREGKLIKERNSGQGQSGD